MKVLEDGSKGMSAAVKLALGETQLIQNTKAFLEENGVCLDAFNQVSLIYILCVTYRILSFIILSTCDVFFTGTEAEITYYNIGEEFAG